MSPQPGPVSGAAHGARTLVIGWDGATWSLADRFVAAGDMPVLAELMAKGARAPLNSTTPPMTLPSWSSMLTGCNPGRHGIFDFAHRIPGTFRLGLTNATHRRVPTLHRVLSDRGARVASIAVPTTWPPEPLNGVVVAGFDSPVSTGIDGSFCHPPGLHQQLLERFGGLAFADFQESRIGPGWHDAALAALRREIPRKAAIGEWMLGQERWELFMLLFGESDTVSHHFWMFHDSGSPRHPARVPAHLRHAIRTIYRDQDQALGRLLEAAQPEVVCICSDHGFGGAGTHVLYLNRLLEAQGWLRYARQVQVQGLRSGTGLLDRARSAAVERLPARFQGRVYRAVPDPLIARVEAASRYGDLAREGTRAFSDELNYAATVHLSVEPQQRAMAVEQLSALLLAWEVDGHRPVRAVHSRESLYEGPCVERSPDLVLELDERDGYTYTLLPSGRVPAGQTWRVLEGSEHMGGKGLGMNGSHRQHGVLLLQGRGVAAGAHCDADMADIAPTLLTLMGESVPEHMDGRVLNEALEAPGQDDRAEWTGQVPPERPTAPDEDAVIRERLARLGYL